MDEVDEQTINPTKVRIGLAVVVVVVAVALVAMVLIDSAAGKAIMFAVALSAIVRAFLLFRAIKRDRQAGLAA